MGGGGGGCGWGWGAGGGGGGGRVSRPRVVIVGAGFGGLRAARTLRHAPIDVVLIDRHNYHLFQPLLYQVATSGLSPEHIAMPARAILRGPTNIDIRLGALTGVDFSASPIGL